MNGTIDPSADYVRRLSEASGREWPGLTIARASAYEVRELLSVVLSTKLNQFSTGDLDLVVFGSLARREWTAGSDIDWTLLIDGQASPEHRVLAAEISRAIEGAEYQGRRLLLPGAEGIFGNLAFGHDLIHYIGGQADTNRNTTQRVLMLLEAAPIRHQGHAGESGPYERIIRNILYRYLHDDTNFASLGATGSRIPRFLLNDFVRYWRTMCVDFAYKEWEQAGGKWAIRNIKLRMSRKLLFVSALVMVFSCYSNDSLQMNEGNAKQYIPVMQGHLTAFARSTAIDILVWAFIELGLPDLAVSVLDSYEPFLQQLCDEAVRKHLCELPAGEIYQDDVFLKLREHSHRFQDALTSAFFQRDTELKDFTIKFGVF